MMNKQFTGSFLISTTTTTGEVHEVMDAIRQIGDNSWLIGGRIILSRTKSPSRDQSRVWWSDSEDGFFAISIHEKSQDEQTPTEELPKDCPIQKVYEAGGNVAWRIGEAFCKVKALLDTECTREHVTLDYLQDLAEPLSFPVPQSLYHAEFDGRYYLFTSRLPGRTLEKAWPTMTESDKEFCADRLVTICKELISRGGKRDTICGVDGAHIGETWMAPPRQDVKDYSPQAQLAYCRELSMDCSDLVFQQNDMGPQNIIVDFPRMSERTIGIIDWEMAGFVPRDWIKTKFQVCFAWDFDFTGNDVEGSRDMRERVQQKLGQEGFHNVREAYLARWKASGPKS